jgi:hypothetical protein
VRPVLYNREAMPLAEQTSVSNPNWFNVDFKEITADVKYPGVDSKFGGGTLYNVNFAGHAQSGFSFPLALK